MNDIEKILKNAYKEKETDLTKTESKIHSYILNNTDQIIYSSMSQVSKILGVSDASIDRYFTKLGFNNFLEFKMDLFKQVELLAQISNGSFYESIYENIIATLTETKKSINLTNIENAVKLINNAENVIICGMGVSNITAKDCFSKLLRLGINATFIDDSHFLMMKASLLTKNDILICYSFTGETEEIVKTATLAKQNGAKIISISGYMESALIKKSNIVLKSFGYDKSLELGFNAQKISQLYVTDVLITKIALTQKNKSLDNIKKTTQSLIWE